jgi:hypothetical protein
MPWMAVFQWQWTGVDRPVHCPIDMVNPRLNGMGMVTLLWVRTYHEVWSWCTALSGPVVIH